MKLRLKDYKFWVAVAAVFVGIVGMQPEDFTSWKLLFDSIVSAVKNPFQFFGFIIAVIGIWENWNGKGLFKD